MSTIRRAAMAATLAMGMVTLPGLVFAEQGIAPYLEYGKRIEAAQSLSVLKADAFGESVSLYNGATEFSVTDIELPGNNALRVHLTRRHAVQFQPQGIPSYDERYGGLGNWDIHVPHISATYPDRSPWPSDRCSGNPVPPTPIGFLQSEIWNGISVDIPGRGSSPLLVAGPRVPVPSVGGPYRFATRERDVIDCIPMKSGLAGEGFRLTTADGTRYYFDVAVTRTASRLERVIWDGEGNSWHWRIPRTKFYLLASKVEDRHGNTVAYSYSAEGFPSQITASDGRSLLLTYSSGRLVSATANGKTWRYAHDLTSEYPLRSVTLPDGSAWRYAYVGGLKPSTLGMDSLPPFPYCQQNPLPLDGTYELQATHPSGLAGKFSFANTRHYRSGVHANECYPLNLRAGAEPDWTLFNPHFSDIVSLRSKELSGPGIAGTLRWEYDYFASPNNFTTLWGSYGGTEAYPCTTCNPHKVVVVKNPDGSRARHTFGMLYLVNEGRPLRQETLDASGAVVRDEATTYLPDSLASQQAFYPFYGGVLGGLGERTHTYIRPVVERTVTQDGRKFGWRVKATCGSGQTYCFDSLARPTLVGKSSAPAP